jgi:hypothetical protein
MSNPMFVSTVQSAPARNKRSFDLRLVFGLLALVLGVLLATQLPHESAAAPRQGGRVLAATPVHGAVTAGKQTAASDKFPAGGVKPGRQTAQR